MKTFLYVNAMLDPEVGEAYKLGFEQALSRSPLSGQARLQSLDLMYGERVSARLMGMRARDLEVDALILSGSEKNTTDRSDPWLKDYLWGLSDLLGLRDRDPEDWPGPPCPVLGVCFGHQVLACAFGGETSRFQDRVGFVRPQLMHQGRRHPVLQKLRAPSSEEGLSLGASHADQVVRLPRGFHLLATSDYCEVQAMGHDQWPILSVQTHPEITSIFQQKSREKEVWGAYSLEDFENQDGPRLLQTWYQWALTQ